MNEIEKIRLEIDQIHIQLVDLFRRRLVLSRKIWELKKRDNLPFIDTKRESKIVHQFDSVIVDTDEQKSVQNLFACILKESKDFLEAKFK